MEANKYLESYSGYRLRRKWKVVPSLRDGSEYVRIMVDVPSGTAGSLIPIADDVHVEYAEHIVALHNAQVDSSEVKS